MNILIFFSALAVQQAWTLDILHISLTASPSHHIWEKTLVTALHQRGHKITMVTSSVEQNKENLTFIHLEGVYEKLHTEFDYELLINDGTFKMINLMFEWMTSVCKCDLETDGLQSLIDMARAGTKFDLVLMDMLTAKCFYPVLEMFGPTPMVGTSPMGIVSFYTFTFGTDLCTSHIPFFASDMSHKMNFIERSTNYFFVNLYNFLYKYSYVPGLTSMLEEKFGKGFTPLDEFEKNVSIILANYDPVMNYPQPLPPNIIPVGGLHTKRAKALPEDLKKYLDEAKDGAVLFSMGTNVRSDKLGARQRRAFLDAFSRLKERVIWKFESDIADLPGNVIVRKWLPQNDIQAHPNMRLFITHGGALSTQEAMYHGLPVLGLPFFADQRENMHRMAARKLGKKLDYRTLTADELHGAIREVIDNPIYKENAAKLSQRYRDQPQDPLERAVFWAEYVARHKGADFLSVQARHMSFIELFHLDLWAAILLAVALVYYYLKSKTFRTKPRKFKTK